MKKIVLLLAFCLSIGNVFAQDADKLRDEGDAALKAKNYAEAFTKYDGFLKQTMKMQTVFSTVHLPLSRQKSMKML
nr:hypothetical protein [Parabacteroides goldsteinii]